jgi:hypothetical protein
MVKMYVWIEAHNYNSFRANVKAKAVARLGCQRGEQLHLLAI